MKLWWYSSQVPCYGSHLDPQSLLCSQVGSSEVAGSQDWECGLQEPGLDQSSDWIHIVLGVAGGCIHRRQKTHTGCEWHWPTGLQSGWDRQKAGWLLLASCLLCRGHFLLCHALLSCYPAQEAKNCDPNPYRAWVSFPPLTLGYWVFCSSNKKIKTFAKCSTLCY